MLVNKHLVSPRDSTRVTTTRPQGLIEFIPAKISSIVGILSQTIELSSRIHKKPICVVLGSGLIGQYIGDYIAQLFDIVVNEEEGYEQLTLVDGSKVQVQEYVSF